MLLRSEDHGLKKNKASTFVEKRTCIKSVLFDQALCSIAVVIISALIYSFLSDRMFITSCMTCGVMHISCSMAATLTEQNGTSMSESVQAAYRREREGEDIYSENGIRSWTEITHHACIMQKTLTDKILTAYNDQSCLPSKHQTSTQCWTNVGPPS